MKTKTTRHAGPVTRLVERGFAIHQQLTTLNEEFKKIKETDETIELEMKPANFFISLLVNSIHIDFDKARKRMTHFKGRMPLREQVNGRWKALDAEIIYP